MVGGLVGGGRVGWMGTVGRGSVVVGSAMPRWRLGLTRVVSVFLGQGRHPPSESSAHTACARTHTKATRHLSGGTGSQHSRLNATERPHRSALIKNP